MKLTDFNNLTNFGIWDPRMTTIAGIAFRHLDRLPRQGDKVTVEGFEITVLEMDAHRIARVRVAKGGTPDTPPPLEPPPAAVTGTQGEPAAALDAAEVGNGGEAPSGREG
jgi:hypothetical protein